MKDGDLGQDFQQLHPFSQAVIEVIRSIPRGKVQTYGGIAALAGNPRGARQVARLLHSLSHKYHLPWFRIINAQGKISLANEGAAEQRTLLEAEQIFVSPSGKIDLEQYLWRGDN